MTAYYNEIDDHAAQWLRNLIAAGHIAPGVVDQRSIEDVIPAELSEFTQCHFFAGIGIWSLALRYAGWPDSRPVWTGSCPCQPFSAAGKGEGVDDERHLWPAWHHLIGEQQPAECFGEQVASMDGLAWLDIVQSDLEGTNYACGPVDHCAAGYGSPNIRQRLYFAAERLGDTRREHIRGEFGKRIGTPETFEREARQRQRRGDDIGRSSANGRLADTDGRNPSPKREQCGGEQRQLTSNSGVFQLAYDRGGVAVPMPVSGLWRDADWLLCRDGRWRPVEPGTFPLAHGAASRVGRLRAYGNGLNLAQATAFIAAYMECRP